jgi:hypothetical protein
MSVRDTITIKELTRIRVEPGEILAIQLPEGSEKQMHDIGKQLRVLPQFKNALIYCGEWKFHAIKIEQVNEIKEAQAFLHNLKEIK